MIVESMVVCEESDWIERLRPCRKHSMASVAFHVKAGSERYLVTKVSICVYDSLANVHK